MMLYYFPNRPILFEPNHPKVQELSNDPNWDAEVKKNGSRLILRKTDKFEFWNRDKTLMKYTPDPQLLAELDGLNIPSQSQLDSELLHFKTKKINHLIYFYDVYILDGEKQRGTLQERRKVLDSLVGGEFKHLTIAKRYENNFKNLFDKVIQNVEDEGLVMKDKRGKIVWNPNKGPDVTWQVKIRRATKNYKF